MEYQKEGRPVTQGLPIDPGAARTTPGLKHVNYSGYPDVIKLSGTHKPNPPKRLIHAPKYGTY